MPLILTPESDLPCQYQYSRCIVIHMAKRDYPAKPTKKPKKAPAPEPPAPVTPDPPATVPPVDPDPPPSN